MNLRGILVASFVACAPSAGCVPSFDGLSGEKGASGHAEVDAASCTEGGCDCDGADGCADRTADASAALEASSCESGDSCDAFSCDGQACNTLAGYALHFNGQQVVRVAPGPVNDMTIEMWLKTTQFANGGNWYDGGALYFADKPGPANDFGASIAHDKFAFGTGNPDWTALSKTSINTGAWFHVAATRVQSTGVVRVYVNGNLEGILSTGNTGLLGDSPPPWMGGMITNGRTVVTGFEGTIDELRVWSTARTAAEITATMHVRLRGDEPGLASYWHFDDGVGTIATDSTSAHNDGSLGYGYPDLAPTWERSDAPITAELSADASAASP
jgi:hypothetical protein